MRRVLNILFVNVVFCLFGELLRAEVTIPIKVVATLPTFAHLAEIIGGERVTVCSIVSPRFNPHFIEPKPTDVLNVKKCELFIHGGLDLEAWKESLIIAAGRGDLKSKGRRDLSLASGLRILEVLDRLPSRAEGDIHLFGNPHTWLDPLNVRVMAQAILNRITEIDPEGKELYLQNFTSFVSKLDNKILEWKEKVRSIKGKEFVAYHNEWVYFSSFLGLEVKMFLEPKPGIPPTPFHLVEVKSYIREKKIPLIIQASFYPKEAGEKLSKELGVKFKTLCQNVGELVECSDYISMMDYNINTLVSALL